MNAPPPQPGPRPDTGPAPWWKRVAGPQLKITASRPASDQADRQASQEADRSGWLGGSRVRDLWRGEGWAGRVRWAVMPLLLVFRRSIAVVRRFRRAARLLVLVVVLLVGVAAGWLISGAVLTGMTGDAGEAPLILRTPTSGLTIGPGQSGGQSCPGSGPSDATEPSQPDGDLGGGPEGVSRASRSRAGAVVAAAQYATLLARIWPMTPAQAAATLADAASASYRSELVATLPRELVPMQAQARSLGGRTTYRQAVLATRFLTPTTGPAPVTAGPGAGVHEGRPDPGSALSSSSVNVKVWTLLVISHTTGGDGTGGDDLVNARGVFISSQIELVWERGAWRLAGSSDRVGPTPLLAGAPSTGSQLTTQLRGFDDWRPQ